MLLRTNEMAMFLYRGLRKEEVNAGNLLIPKGSAGFDDDLSLMVVNGSGERELRQFGPLTSVGSHLRGEPTIGVSASANFDIAASYAMSGLDRTSVVVRINRNLFKQFNIEEIWVESIFKPYMGTNLSKDREVILTNKLNIFPRAIVDRTYSFNSETSTWVEIDGL